MERGFQTHKIRKATELNGLWEFRAGEETRKVSVPSCWENYPGFENYEGKAVYEKKFRAGGNLHFLWKGVSHTGVVCLDGEKIAEHYNAFTPFETVVPDVKPGEHKLTIEVDNSFNEESALHIPNDYFTYGGINRPVIVEEVRDCFIERLHIRPWKEGELWHGEITVRVRQLKPLEGIKLRLLLGEEEVFCAEANAGCGVLSRVEAATDKKENSGFGNAAGEEVYILKMDLIFPKVKAYELEEPNLYYLTAQLIEGEEIVDDLIERIGFREVRVRGKEILFNDKPIQIKGFNRHEDHAMYGCAIPYEAMDYDLRLIEDMGANAVRTCHYPNDERFLDLCDEKGILVWEEGHARGLSEEQMRHKNFRSQSLDCIREMIDNHYNHPCIFTWGILNECASETEYGREIYIEQFDLIRSMDKSRPVTFASCKMECDICLDLVDIVSMNIYPLWYHDSPAEEYVNKVYDWVQTTEGAGKPYIVSEIGAGGIPGYHAWGNPKWSEERQAEILEAQIRAVFAHKETSGLFIWQFCDCRISAECFYGRPRTMNNKGVVDEYRRKKMAYDTVKRLFRDK